jgi:branched-chain amino acid transport system substrate-binding protein
MIRPEVVAVVFVATFLGFSCAPGSAPKGTIEIGYIGAGSMGGDYSGPGQPNQLGAAFAIARAGSVRGFTLKFVALDDTEMGAFSADKGEEDVRQLISDDKVLGVVGPLRSPVAYRVTAVANLAHLAIISPTNTYPCLTLVRDYCQMNGQQMLVAMRPTGKNNYFRIAASETYLGPAMADFAYETLGLRKIAVWDDQEASGQDIADRFTSQFTRRGGSVVARQGFVTTNVWSLDGTWLKPDLQPWLRQAKAAGAEAIYAGAWNHVCLARQESQGIFAPNSYYLGPDGAGDLSPSGMTEDDCISEAGAMANDHLFASRGLGDAYLNPSAAATLAAYAKLHPDPSDTNPHTFAGYDSAAILIDAIGRAIDADGGKMPSRQEVIDQIGKTTNFPGLTGTYTFSSLGDPTTPTLQILQYRAGAWTPVNNITVAAS